MIEMYFLIDIYLIQICTEENRKIGRKPCMSMLQCYSATVSGLMSNNPGPLSQCPVLKMSKCHHPPNSHPHQPKHHNIPPTTNTTIHR